MILRMTSNPNVVTALTHRDVLENKPCMRYKVLILIIKIIFYHLYLTVQYDCHDVAEYL